MEQCSLRQAQGKAVFPPSQGYGGQANVQCSELKVLLLKEVDWLCQDGGFSYLTSFLPQRLADAQVFSVCHFPNKFAVFLATKLPGTVARGFNPWCGPLSLQDKDKKNLILFKFNPKYPSYPVKSSLLLKRCVHRLASQRGEGKPWQKTRSFLFFIALICLLLFSQGCSVFHKENRRLLTALNESGWEPKSVAGKTAMLPITIPVGLVTLALDMAIVQPGLAGYYAVGDTGEIIWPPLELRFIDRTSLVPAQAIATPIYWTGDLIWRWILPFTKNVPEQEEEETEVVKENNKRDK